MRWNGRSGSPAVAQMIYLIFNEGYSADSGEAPARAPLCDEAIRLARLLLQLFQTEPEIMGLMALMLLQHARAPARFDADGDIVLLDDQDRSMWNRDMIAEGLALIDKAMRHARAGPYQVQAAIAALHDRAARPQDTDWAQIDLLYANLELMQPSPIITLNRAVAVAKVRGAEAALAMIEPLGSRLSGYFYFHGVRGAFLLAAGPRRRGSRRLRQGHSARQHPRRGRPHPYAARPARGPAHRRAPQPNLSRAVDSARGSPLSSLATFAVTQPASPEAAARPIDSGSRSPPCLRCSCS